MTRRVIYHADCNDGLFAAAAMYTKFGDTAEYLPMHYGDPMPPPPEEECDLYFVDFSIPHRDLVDCAAYYKTITVIDHHKTAQADLSQPLPESVDVIFDMEKSGARLAWEFCHPRKEVPFAAQLVEDRDLWRFKLEDSRSFFYGSLLLKPNLRDCAAMLHWSVIGRRLLLNCVSDGKVIARLYDQKAQRIAEGAHPDTWVRFADSSFIVPVLNLTENVSDTLNAVLLRWKEAPFAASYFDLPHKGERVYSLRSTDGRVDVSHIARRLGGGGHRNAAGFKRDL